MHLKIVDGFRPVFSISSIQEIEALGIKVKKLSDGIWSFQGRNVPQDTVADIQEELNRKYNEKKLVLSREKHYPKFRKKGRLLDTEFNSEGVKNGNIEYLDEYVDPTDGRIYAVRKTDKNTEFEECKPIEILAEQITDDKILCVCKDLYWGGIAFSNGESGNINIYGYKKDTLFSKSSLHKVLNQYLQSFIDVRLPEKESLIDISDLHVNSKTETVTESAFSSSSELTLDSSVTKYTDKDLKDDETDDSNPVGTTSLNDCVILAQLLTAKFQRLFDLQHRIKPLENFAEILDLESEVNNLLSKLSRYERGVEYERK